MPQLEYAVIAALPDEPTARDYLAWLTSGHIAEIVAAGAASAEIIRLDPDPEGPIRIMTRYRFPSRAAFETYLATAAPRLRADGLARFGPATGVTMHRLLGEVIAAEPR